MENYFCGPLDQQRGVPYREVDVALLSMGRQFGAAKFRTYVRGGPYKEVDLMGGFTVHKITHDSECHKLPKTQQLEEYVTIFSTYSI